MIHVDFKHTINPIPLKDYEERVKIINKMIDDKSGKGNDFLGWTTWPRDYDKNEVARILEAAKRIQKTYDEDPSRR